MSPRVTDLWLVVALVVGGALALVVPGVPWQVEWAFALPLLLVAPGYAVVAALFPERPRGSETMAGHPTRDGPPGWPARAGLALVLSAVLVALVGVTLATVGPVDLALAPVVVVLGGVTLLAVGVAGLRRVPFPPERRADPVAGRSSGSLAGSLGLSGLQSVVLVLSAALLVSTLALAGTNPVVEPYSEVYLTDGEGVDLEPGAGTRTLDAGGDTTLALALENHEGTTADYRVVIRLQRVADDGSVLEKERLADYRVGLGAGETAVTRPTLDPTMTGEGLRLQVLVFEGDVSGAVDVDDADLTLGFRVDVVAEGSA